MEFTKVSKLCTGGPVSWYSGIYKIVAWRKNEYRAFYIRDGRRNWGKFVAVPPHIGLNGVGCWDSFRAAVEACEEHAQIHTPTRLTQDKARSIFGLRQNTVTLDS